MEEKISPHLTIVKPAFFKKRFPREGRPKRAEDCEREILPIEFLDLKITRDS